MIVHKHDGRRIDLADPEKACSSSSRPPGQARRRQTIRKDSPDYTSCWPGFAAAQSCPENERHILSLRGPPGRQRPFRQERHAPDAVTAATPTASSAMSPHGEVQSMRFHRQG